KFTDNFKREAVNLVVEQGYTVPQAAETLGIPTKLLYTWRKHYVEKSKPGSLISDERQELLLLRKENKQLKIEKEILKKASAFFAKELL
ncbi:transposase, partial [Xenorhabdus bovienii]|uniref:transposase n=2 Tax=Xenorhabdus bovienii TaxID=40576 RepID=UPI0034DEEBDF|nr:transposase [Xenorhabdus bovienii]MDE9471332.1 transposase [Xenorhabdus bovienii]